MRLILAINVPAAMGMVLLAGPIIRVLFERGQFRSEDTQTMIPVLAVFAVGLPLFAYVNLMLRAFYAQKDTRTPVKAALISFGVNIALSFALKGIFSTLGLALASTIAVAVQTWFLQRALTKVRPELAFARLHRDVFKILVAALVMGGVVWLARWGLAGMGEGFGQDVVRLVVMIPVGAAAFAGWAYVMKLEGRVELLDLVRKRLGVGHDPVARP